MSMTSRWISLWRVKERSDMALSAIDDLVASQIGTEKVNNGDFTLTTYWTYGQASGGWSYDGTNDEADCDGSQTAGVDLEQDISAVAAEIYLLQYTISNWVAGEVTPQIGGVDGTARGASGTYENYITATGTGNLKFQADSDFNGTIDDVTVKKVLFPTAYTVRLTWSNADSYGEIAVQYDKGAGWQQKEVIDAGETSYDFDDVVPNILYNFRLECTDPLAEDPDVISNTDSSACWADTPVDEIKVSESVTDYATAEDVSDTITDTMYVSDFIVDATDILTNYTYYVATADGKVYEYSGYYKSDGGTAITAQWESKDTDFADQSIENSDKFKTVEFVRLHFMDKSAGALIDVRVSTDGGASWTTKTKNIGTGNNKGKTKDFHFVITGQIFRFAIRSVSTSDDFQWVGMEIFYSVGGDYFEV